MAAVRAKTIAMMISRKILRDGNPCAAVSIALKAKGKAKIVCEKQIN